MKARLHDLMYGGDGAAVLSLRCDRSEAEKLFRELRDTDVSVEIKKAYKRRSLDANAYCFVLIGKIAERLCISKEDVYRSLVKDIGGNYDVVCVRDEAVPQLRKAWEGHGIGWQTDTLTSKIAGCTNVILYYGSSTYDSAQMNRLINLATEQCADLGIETMQHEELQSLLESWKGRN